MRIRRIHGMNAPKDPSPSNEIDQAGWRVGELGTPQDTCLTLPRPSHNPIMSLAPLAHELCPSIHPEEGPSFAVSSERAQHSSKLSSASPSLPQDLWRATPEEARRRHRRDWPSVELRIYSLRLVAAPSPQPRHHHLEPAHTHGPVGELVMWRHGSLPGL